MGRARRPRPHPFEELREAAALCSHLRTDHDYAAGRWPGVSLLHQAIDIAVGVVDSIARDERRSAMHRELAETDLREMRLDYLVIDHERDHD